MPCLRPIFAASPRRARTLADTAAPRPRRQAARIRRLEQPPASSSVARIPRAGCLARSRRHRRLAMNDSSYALLGRAGACEAKRYEIDPGPRACPSPAATSNSRMPGPFGARRHSLFRRQLRRQRESRRAHHSLAGLATPNGTSACQRDFFNAGNSRRRSSCPPSRSVRRETQNHRDLPCAQTLPVTLDPPQRRRRHPYTFLTPSASPALHPERSNSA